MHRLATLLHIPYREIRSDIAARKGDLLTPITIKENVKEDKINYLLEHQNDFPGVQINQTYQRHYDQGGIAAQTLGYVSEISQQQLDAANGQGRLRRRRPHRPDRGGGDLRHVPPRPARDRARLRRRARPRDERPPVPAASRSRRQRAPHDRRRAAEDRGRRARLRHQAGPRRRPVGSRRRRARRHGSQLRGDPCAGLEPHLRPEHLHGARRQEGPGATRRPHAPTTRRSTAPSQVSIRPARRSSR